MCAALKVLAGCWAVHLQGRGGGRKEGAASCPAALCCPPLHSPAHRVAALPAISMAVWGCLCPQGCRGGTETRWRAEDRRVSCSGSILVRMPICKAEGKEGRKKGAASCPAALCCPPLHSPAHRVAALKMVSLAVWVTNATLTQALQSAGPVPAPAVGPGLSKAAPNVEVRAGGFQELPWCCRSTTGSSLELTYLF